ncbi:MAG: hypothetical protein ABJC79_01000 [Acidimicrobiia bacterium]
MAENENPLERAVELFVYAPIGLAMFAKDTVPTFMKMFVARGQTEVTQRRKTAETQAGQYKTIGQMAVKYGGPEVKRQAEAAAGTVRKRAEDTIAGIAATTAPAVTPTGAPPMRSTPDSTRATPTPNQTARASAPGALAIPDYDLLSATQVIDRLTGLARPDLLAVQAYEAAHRARTTILGKITQLSR